MSTSLIGVPSTACRIPGAPRGPVLAVGSSRVRSELAPRIPARPVPNSSAKGGGPRVFWRRPLHRACFRPRPFWPHRGHSRVTCTER
eukprot:6781078-Pyramimonas_sp.AAC.1